MSENSRKIVIYVHKDEVAGVVGEKNGSFISNSYMNDVTNALRERILDEFDFFLEEAVAEVNENFKNGDFNGDFEDGGTTQQELNNEIWRKVDEAGDVEGNDNEKE